VFATTGVVYNKLDQGNPKTLLIMVRLNNLQIRTAALYDRVPLAHLRACLWPESSSDEHARELTAILDTTAQRVLPLIIFVAEETDGALVGFLEAGLRSCADGYDVSRPVGYVEGWFVEEHRRGQDIARQLLRAAEDWARAQGCREMASDAIVVSKTNFPNACMKHPASQSLRAASSIENLSNAFLRTAAAPRRT